MSLPAGVMEEKELSSNSVTTYMNKPEAVNTVKMLLMMSEIIALNL
jgi:hypothetical protein